MLVKIPLIFFFFLFTFYFITSLTMTHECRKVVPKESMANFCIFTFTNATFAKNFFFFKLHLKYKMYLFFNKTCL